MNKKYKKVCTTVTYIEQFLISASKITGCISISAFSSLICSSIGITSFCNSCRNLLEYNKSIIKKKKKRHDKIEFLAKCSKRI